MALERKILAVDDSPVMVRLVTDVIGGLGHGVEGHTHPIDALNAFKTSPDSYSMLVTDNNMRDMTGIDLIASIRTVRESASLRGHLPIIMISGDTFDVPTLKALEDSGVKLLRKPFADLSVLENAVLQALKDSQNQE